jgi:hypothetical protein
MVWGSNAADGGAEVANHSSEVLVVGAMFRGLATGSASRQAIAAAASAALRTTAARQPGGTAATMGTACDSEAAEIIMAAKSAHEQLDRMNGKHNHSLSGAIRESRGLIEKNLAVKLSRLAKAADAMRHITAFSLKGLLEELGNVQVPVGKHGTGQGDIEMVETREGDDLTSEHEEQAPTTPTAYQGPAAAPTPETTAATPMDFVDEGSWPQSAAARMLEDALKYTGADEAFMTKEDAEAARRARWASRFAPTASEHEEQAPSTLTAFQGPAAADAAFTTEEDTAAARLARRTARFAPSKAEGGTKRLSMPPEEPAHGR